MEPSRWSGLLPPNLEEVVKPWLAHDIPAFDVGGLVVGRDRHTAVFWAKSPLVAAGYPFVEAIFNQLGCQVQWSLQEGSLIEAGKDKKVEMGRVVGSVNRVLQGERTALEVLTRCSAVAYETSRAAEAARKAGWKGRIAATRKTTPGCFRLVEKYGVLVGGGDTHRYSLSGMTMLKDNHIDAAGSITKAVHAAKAAGGFSMKVEVEARTVDEAGEACTAGADVVMLDNFTPQALAASAPALKARYPHVIFEVSGGITHSTLHNFLHPGLDILSMGCLTHGTPPVDISLKIIRSSSSKL